ncbi:hypothetical protein GTQ40_00465 [Flavobacteriaceae bacterium R38]|nr:hypothetical protein [Flavobacteriaceae bacterium R38]
MKKKKLKSLSLNKKTISNFKSGTVSGGGVTNSCFPDGCDVAPTCTCRECGESQDLGCDATRYDHTCINGGGVCGGITDTGTKHQTATACTFIGC